MTTLHYLQTSLEQLRPSADIPQPKNPDELVETIFKILTSKKFRKYALTDEYAQDVRSVIRKHVQNNQPLSMTFFGGCYKLWRLDEAPEADWAELFACMYYTRWVAPICALYKPGVWFDFFLDDAIVPRINNLSEKDIQDYAESRQKILDFLKPYQPDNLRMTNTGISSLFPSRKVYEQLLEQHIEKLAKELPGGLPTLTDAQLATTSLNVKATPEQLTDPKWREKVELIHSAYMNVKGSTNYANPTDKIRVFTQPFVTGTCIAVGTTKDSIAKFWAGVGALRPRDDSFRQIVLSPKQLQAATFTWEDIHLDGLDGKNFFRIRILK